MVKKKSTPTIINLFIALVSESYKINKIKLNKVTRIYRHLILEHFSSARLIKYIWGFNIHYHQPRNSSNKN